MKKLFIILFFLLGINSYCQMLDNTKGEAFGEKPFFNQNFIKKNKIKLIKGFYSTKTDLDVIRENPNTYVYEFNQDGQLVKEILTKFGDTIVSIYAYDKNNNLILIRKSDSYGFHSHHFEYNNENQLIKKEYRRDINKSGDKINFDLDKSYIISSETYTYEITPIGLKKQYYNSQNILYQTEFFYRNEDGYLLKQESQLKTGAGRSQTEFKYGDKGLLIEKSSETFITQLVNTKFIFEYDENQNILAQHYYRNGEYQTEFQIIYERQTMLLSALLTRDVKTNFITIIKFSYYEFFE